MKAYKLIEKRQNYAHAIVYKVVPSLDGKMVNVFLIKPAEVGEETEFWFSSYIKETKRGWTITAWLLTIKPVKIFLPRENFEKVEIEE